MELMNGVLVVFYNSKIKVLIVLDSNKKLFVFMLDDKMKLDYNIIKFMFVGLELLLNEGCKFDLMYVGIRVLFVKVIYKYEGMFSGLDINKKIISILFGN